MQHINCNTTEKQLQTVHPAIRQLYALGYKEGDIVTGRCMSATETYIDKDGNEKDKITDFWGYLGKDNINLWKYDYDATRKERGEESNYFRNESEINSWGWKIHHPDGLGWLKNKNEKENCQIFYNVNGCRLVSECTGVKAAFFENDNLSMDEQWEVIAKLPIQPTVCVTTRKSIHTYFRLSESNKESWQELQSKLILAVASDPANKDFPRLMRLAGFYHVKVIDGKISKVMCNLKACEPDRLYSHEQVNLMTASLLPMPYTKERFDLYIYINNRSNLKKYSFPLLSKDIVYSLPEDKVREWHQRCEVYCSRVVDITDGESNIPDPASAFTEPFKKIKKEYKELTPNLVPTDISTINSLNEGGFSTLFDVLASRYCSGYRTRGGGEIATFRCPVHGTEDTNPTVTHVNRLLGWVKCHMGCSSRQIKNEIRKRAKKAGDPLADVQEWIREENVNKLEITIKGGDTKFIIPMTEEEKVSYLVREQESIARKKEADKKDAIADIEAQLNKLNGLRQVTAIAITDVAVTDFNKPTFILPEYFFKEAVFTLLDFIQSGNRINLVNLTKKDIHRLLRANNKTGISRYGKDVLIGGPNPQKTIKTVKGTELVWQVDVDGNYLRDSEGQLMPELQYTAEEWAKIQECVELLKGIDLKNHQNLFADVKSNTVELYIDHPNKEWVAGLINQRYNQSLDHPGYACLFRLENLPHKPFVPQRQWEQNSIDSVSRGIKKRYFDEWKRLTDFVADNNVSSDFIGNEKTLRDINIIDGNIHLVSGGCGGGKTTELNRKIVDLVVYHPILPNGNPIKIICNSHRLNLIANTKGKLRKALIAEYIKTGLPEEEAKIRTDAVVMDAEKFKNDHGTFWGSWSNDKGLPLVLYTCTDSLPPVIQRMPKYAKGESRDGETNYNFMNDVVFISDEIDAVLKHTVIGSTCRRNRLTIFTIIEDLLNNCLGVFGLSGTLNESCKRLFKGINKKLITYKNTFTRDLIPIQYSLGTGNYDEKDNRLYLNEMKRSFILDLIYDALRRGENVLIPSDSKDWNAILEELIKINVGDNLVGCRIDSIEKVSEDEARRNMVNEIMTDPPSGILNNKIRYLIYNSSAESGVDISMPEIENQKYFTKIFAFNFGVIGTAGIIQLLRRWRHSADILLWSIPGRSGGCDFPQIPSHLLLKQQQQQQSDGNDSKDNFLLEEYKDSLRRDEYGLAPHDAHLTKYHEIANELKFVASVERRHPRLCLEYMLKKHGYAITHTFGEDSDSTTSEGSKIYKARVASKILNADRKYCGSSDLENIMQTVTSEVDIWALTLAFYLRKWGYSREDLEQDNTPLLTDDFIIHNEFTERSFYDHCKNYIYAGLSEADLKLIHTVSDDEKTFVKDVKLVLTPMAFLRDSGIADLIKLDTVPFDSDKITAIKRWAIDKRNQERWALLTDGTKMRKDNEVLGDKAFLFQLKQILSKYFGIKCLLKKGELILNKSDFHTDAVTQLEIGIQQRLFTAKVKAFIQSGSYPEVQTDSRFNDTYNRLLETLNPDDIDSELIMEIVDVNVLSEFRANIKPGDLVKFPRENIKYQVTSVGKGGAIQVRDMYGNRIQSATCAVYPWRELQPTF